jgi:hypothetical protein
MRAAGPDSTITSASSASRAVQGDCRMLLPLVWGVLAIECVLYGLLAVWLTEVLPDSNGVRKSVFYPFKPSFWRPQRYRTRDVHLKQLPGAPTPAHVDGDVKTEADMMRRRLALELGMSGSDGEAAVEVYGLQKRFSSLFGRNAFWAITGSWFQIPQRQLFCLLGPNGAGSLGCQRLRCAYMIPSCSCTDRFGQSELPL